MIVARSPEELARQPRAVAVGSFDGVHLGHRTVLEALKPSQSFAIVSDHEPRPLQYQIQAKFPGLFDWTYVEQGPDVWRVVISREENSGCECCCGS